MALALVVWPALAAANGPAGDGHVWVPPSSKQKPSDVGVRGHTNIEVLIPKHVPNTPPPAPPKSRPGAEHND